MSPVTFNALKNRTKRWDETWDEFREMETAFAVSIESCLFLTT